MRRRKQDTNFTNWWEFSEGSVGRFFGLNWFELVWKRGFLQRHSGNLNVKRRRRKDRQRVGKKMGVGQKDKAEKTGFLTQRPQRFAERKTAARHVWPQMNADLWPQKARKTEALHCYIVASLQRYMGSVPCLEP